MEGGVAGRECEYDGSHLEVYAFRSRRSDLTNGSVMVAAVVIRCSLNLDARRWARGLLAVLVRTVMG